MGVLPAALLLAGCSSADISPQAALPGLTGSAARFAVQGSRLYSIDNQNVQVFDISATGTTSAFGAARWLRTVPLGVPIQSIYPTAGSYLFVGTQAGMRLLDATNSQLPQLGNFTQATSCDPLVADSRWAYLTLRPDRPCGGAPSQLQVVDLNDPSRPQAAQNYPLSQPYGLSLEPDSARLFVCDEGLKAYSTKQAPNLVLLAEQAADALDVQASNGWLLVTGQRALTQYRYSGGQFRLLSTIPINRP